MGTPASKTTMSALLRDFWLLQGVPAELWESAGPFWRTLQKQANDGWTGDGQIQFPSRSVLPSGGSVDLATAWANSSPTGSVKWAVTRSQFWQVMMMNWEVMELSSDAQRAYMTSRMSEQEGHITRYMNLMSWYAWHNHGGALARLDGSMTVSGATTLVLKNKACAKFFEGRTPDGSGGDWIDLATDDGSGSSPAGIIPGGPYNITAVDAIAGTLTITPALDSTTNTAIANTNYIFLQGTYAKAFSGFLDWCPLTKTAASTSLYGVTRSSRTERLAGLRYAFKAGEDPYKVVVGMLRRCNELDANIDTLMVPPNVVEQILMSMREKGVTISDYQSETDSKTLRVGTTGFSFTWPGKNEKVKLFGERYLELPEAATGTGIYAGYREADFKYFTYPSGFSWKDYTGQGSLMQIQGTQNVGAQYGHFGQLVQRNTKNQIVAGPTGVVAES